MSSSLLHKRSLLIVTGASRGIGRQIACDLASNIASESCILLIARNSLLLDETANIIIEKHASLEVETLAVDLQDASMVELFDKCLLKIVKNCTNSTPPEVAMVIHNAGSLGPVQLQAQGLMNFAEVSKYFDANLSSMIVMNSIFLKHTDKLVQDRVVINISSLCANKPFLSLHLYCAGKASRDMFMRCLAMEMTSLRVLNYAPGPIDTDMSLEIEQKSFDVSNRDWVRGLRRQNTFVDIEKSVAKLMRLLDENAFESGAHIDYYD